MRRVFAILLLLALAGGCGESGRGSTPAPSRPVASATAAASDDRDLVQLGDERRLDPKLTREQLSSSVRRRKLATLALARLHDLRAVTGLRDALRDPSAEVRSAAALGLGAFESDATDAVEHALIAGIAAETQDSVRGEMLWDLGRVAHDAGLQVLTGSLGDTSSATREGACRGLGAAALHQLLVDSESLAIVASKVASDPAAEVRLACAAALTQLRPPPAASQAPIVEALRRALATGSAETREMAIRALGKYEVPPDALAPLVGDPDPRVAIAAARALGRRTSALTDAPLGTALRRLTDDFVSRPGRLQTPRIHVILALLEAAGPHAATGRNVFPAAEYAFDQLGTLAGNHPSRPWAAAHCAAAKLVDLGRRWPSRLERCGGGAADPAVRLAAEAEVLGATQGADAMRLVFLERLYRSNDARVREAVLGALPTVHASGAPALLTRGLREADLGVLCAAADALHSMASWLLSQPSELDAGIADGTSVDGPRSAALSPALQAAMENAYDQLLLEHEIEGLLSWVDAAKALGQPAHELRLRALATHWNFELRKRARAALEARHAAIPSDPPAPQPNPIDLASLKALPARATVETDRGRFVIAFDGEAAPTTVARFAELARQGFFDGRAIHRVVPGFVVQGGDPRADGYGGPGFTLRCEDNRIRYGRGVVGMALAGRDTGGSQFFVTYAPQPHLDGRYTAFGRVESGMDVVDGLLVGDRITRITLAP